MLIAIAQVRVEGPRWQMVPGYTLTGLFLLVWLVQNRALARKPTRSARTNTLAAGLAVGLGALVLAASIALPTLLPVFRLPHPSGPYEIGTLTYHWVDADRREVFVADRNARRELMVQIWYPANTDPSSPRAPYVPNAGVLAPLARLLHLPGFTVGHLKYITTNAVESAHVTNGEPSYPVLIFSHGRGGYRQHNTVQTEELVSHGYIVAAIDHPYAAAGVVFPDGRVAVFDPRMADGTFEDSMIGYLAQDAIFTLYQLGTLNQSDPNGILTGRLDLRRVGIFGVSLGGEISAEACRREPRLRACLAMDVWMPASVVQTGLQQPTMFITRDAETMRLEGWSQAIIDRTQTTMRAVFERLPGSGYFVRVRGMFHVDFSDAALLSPLTSWLGITGPIDGERARGIINAYSLAFFDRHLKGRPEVLLDGPAEQYPEVLFETRRP
ncbi:MAG: carboxylic ester hydrolase [Acidobacteriota bacterium]